MGIRIGVLGGSGGAGASTFAAVLAWAARFAGASLVDLDGSGGGIDVLLGIERVPGPRWSDLRLDGGRLESGLLLGALPRWYGVPVLAADRSPPERGVPGVVAAAAQAGPVVLNLPRAPDPVRAAALDGCDLVVLLAAARVPALAAARAVLAGLPDPSAQAIGVLLRAGDVPLADAAALLGRPVLGCLSAGHRPVELAVRRPPRALARVASGLLDGVQLHLTRPEEMETDR
ncbi:MAG TPA: hypothetical protein VFT67_06170 [Jatrophihabitantaceae bacterium]|nr:hypothetical protein [Jatrophihabitantaceae bacterium]